MESAYNYTKRILRKYQLQAKKSLGQNFLVDDGVIAEIIGQSGVGKGQNVLEVGPGTGVLTRALAEAANWVWAIELDKVLSKVLTEEFAETNNVAIIQGDALKVKVEDFCPPEAKLKLIANLPYYITSPLINHFLSQRQHFSGITVMVQKEVAERIVAGPGTKDYGILSIAVQVFSQAQILFNVPPNCFLPAPKVSSAVLRLDLLSQPRIEPEEEAAFFATVKGAFGQRRKTLANSLSQSLKLDKDSVNFLIDKTGLSIRARAEELTIADFLRLSRSLSALRA